MASRKKTIGITVAVLASVVAVTVLWIGIPCGCEPNARYTAQQHVGDIANTVTTEWDAAHPGQVCPPSLKSLFEGTPERAPELDPWNRPYVLMCGGSGLDRRFVVVSAGADGKLGNSDDYSAWR